MTRSRATTFPSWILPTLCLACGTTGKVDNGAPTISVSLDPSSEAVSSDTLTCTVTAADPDGDVLTTSFEWTVDGDAAAAAESTDLSSHLEDAFTAGQEVNCTATAVDPEGSSASASVATTIVNTAPVATSVTLTPTTVTTDTMLTATATVTDADPDTLSISYAWRVDDSDVQDGSDPTLDGTLHFDKGQVVRVTATVDDGVDQATAESEPVEVLNTPPDAPEVEITPSSPAAGDDLLCAVVTPSGDADDDSITYGFAWTVDGATFGTVGDSGGADGETETTTWPDDTVPGDAVDFGQSWVCTVTPQDDEEDGASVTATAETPDCSYGDSVECPGESCLDILTVRGGTGLSDGIYALQAGSVSGATYDAWCLMDTNYDGGGWTLIATYSSDGTHTWTWDARRLQDTDTSTVGSVTQTDHDFKSPAYHDVAGTQVLFVHNPSAVWASYAFGAATPTTLGAVIDATGGPSRRTGGAGLAMEAGTLAATGNLNDTMLYFNATDPDGTYPANSWGPTWNASYNNAVTFDDAANSSVGPESWVPNREINETGGGSGPIRGLGWGYATATSTGTTGAATDYLRAFVR